MTRIGVWCWYFYKNNNGLLNFRIRNFIDKNIIEPLERKHLKKDLRCRLGTHNGEVERHHYNSGTGKFINDVEITEKTWADIVTCKRCGASWASRTSDTY